MRGDCLWLHRGQVLDVLQDEQLSSDAIADCEKRPSEYPRAAARGGNQYESFQQTMDTALESISATEISIEADVDGAVNDGVKADMETHDERIWYQFEFLDCMLLPTRFHFTCFACLHCL